MNLNIFFSIFFLFCSFKAFSWWRKEKKIHYLIVTTSSVVAAIANGADFFINEVIKTTIEIRILSHNFLLWLMPVVFLVSLVVIFIRAKQIKDEANAGNDTKQN